jgi:hypothetical protein
LEQEQIKAEFEQRVIAVEVKLQQLQSEAEGKATEHAQFQEAAANQAAEADRKATELSAKI